MQERLTASAQDGTAVMRCHFGLTEVAIPVRIGGERVAILTTGQVLSHIPSETQLAAVEKSVAKLGMAECAKKALGEYKKTRVLSRAQLAGTVTLLENFSEQLSARSNQIALHRANAEPIAIVRAKAFIAANLQESITLTDVAKAAFTSTFYICKLFKRHAGMNFTEYVSRMRVERAKGALANRNLRISEIAFEVGFQSLTHFNRVFRQLVGQSPTDYRDGLELKLAA